MINPPTTVSLSTCKLDAFKIPSHPLGLLFLGVLVDKDVDIVLTEETNRSPLVAVSPCRHVTLDAGAAFLSGKHPTPISGSEQGTLLHMGRLLKKEKASD